MLSHTYCLVSQQSVRIQGTHGRSTEMHNSTASAALSQRNSAEFRKLSRTQGTNVHNSQLTMAGTRRKRSDHFVRMQARSKGVWGHAILLVEPARDRTDRI